MVTVELKTQALIDAVNDALLRSFYTSGGELLNESIAEVPILTGALVSSGKVEENSESENPEVHVKYGGGDIKYGTNQHERMDFNHPGGGKAKFLEDPFNRMIPRIIEAAAEAVQGVCNQ